MTRTNIKSMATDSQTFRATAECARQLDSLDSLKSFRDRFEIPTNDAGKPLTYFCGHSLGLMPKSARELLEQELSDWARYGVDAHFKAARPWYSYHEMFRESGARQVGALSGVGEVVMMNSLTVNLHLMMMTFYQPDDRRHKILIEEPCFPSDRYAVQTHLRARGLDPKESLVTWSPPAGEDLLQIDDFESILKEQGNAIALVMVGGVNFFTGQVLDMPRITELAHRHGCMVGLDLAHAVGNVELQLHEWDVDFAVWCSYKYLNSGPGAVAGCFVHEKHGRNLDLPRFAGWWGNDPDSRFRMQLEPDFQPVTGADGWQVSNPPIFSMAPLKASLDLFDEAGIGALRKKSLQLTGFLRFLLEQSDDSSCRIITPPQPVAHGCQLSIIVESNARRRYKALTDAGFVCDFREPDVIRIAPVPLYNSFTDVWNFAQAFSRGR